MTRHSETRLLDLVGQAMRGAGVGNLDLATGLPWLWLIRRPAPTPAGRGILTPSVCLLVQGEKEMLVGSQVLRYGPGCYVQAGLAMPVSGQVIRATDAAPYYGIRVDIDPKEVAAFVLEMQLQLPLADADPPAITVERADDAMLDVFVRLLRLLDRPRDLPVLGRLLKQEDLLEGAALDKYTFLRDAYLQHRRNLVYDGNPPEEPMIEDVETDGDEAAK